MTHSQDQHGDIWTFEHNMDLLYEQERSKDNNYKYYYAVGKWDD